MMWPAQGLRNAGSDGSKYLLRSRLHAIIILGHQLQPEPRRLLCLVHVLGLASLNPIFNLLLMRMHASAAV